MVLKSLLLTIIPDIMTNYTKYKMCNTSDTINKASEEHRLLLDAISKQDARKAEKIIKQHLEGVMDFAKSQDVA